MHRINSMEMGPTVKGLMTVPAQGKTVTVWQRFHDFTVHAVDYLDRRLSSNSAIMSLHQLITHVAVGFAGYLSTDELSITVYEVCFSFCVCSLT